MREIVWAYKTEVGLGMVLYFVFYRSGKKRSFDSKSVPRRVICWIDKHNPENKKKVSE